MEKSILNYFLENVSSEIENFDDKVEHFMKDWSAYRSTSVNPLSDYTVYSFKKGDTEVNIYPKGFNFYNIKKNINFWAEIDTNNRVVYFCFY